MRKFLMAVAATLAFAPAAVFAHGNMKPQHGGVVKMSGETVFELVVKPAAVELYVSEDDEAVAPADATASLVVTAGGKETSVPLTAGKGNAFVASQKLPKGASVGVVVKYKNGTKTFTTFKLP
ncbi:hypothetical protein J5837_00570 [Pseudoxanthomonas helianthi]|uniref:Copper-binding protein n=1 Tax=Pseudoxanthomonas helianthi TaxID=1453541 RepID=A0A940WZM7_9GAMM|nr:hypothetical protein [Pseudoxanthomonas helianthi]MBP3982901.1 hypothetical protein [Pseudoxanthomonas helianthi]